MKKTKSLEVYSAICTAIVAFVNGWWVYISGRNSPPFIDEVLLNINAAKTFFLHGNYTYSDWGDFSPIISTGLWCSFPSGIAAAFFDAPLVKIRFVSFLFSNILVLICLRVALGYFSDLSKTEKWAWSFIFCGLFFSFCPYAESAFMTLGEIPSVAYLGLGLGCLLGSPVLGAFFIGVSVFGGKTVNIAFAGPLIVALTIWPQGPAQKNRLKYFLGFITPLLLWILTIFLCIGGVRTLGWFLGYKAMLVQFLGVARGTQTQIVHIPFLQRFSSPALEWVGYSLIQKSKMLVFLFLPLILIVKNFRRQKFSENLILTPLAVGLLIFSFWYFAIHPYMWIRHVQPALAVGLAILFWYGFNFYRAQSVRTRVTLSLILFLLLTVKLVRHF